MTETVKPVRGRPFKKGNVRGKCEMEIKADTIPETVIPVEPEKIQVEPTKPKWVSKPAKLPIIKGGRKDGPQEIVEEIFFSLGEDVLSIRFSKKEINRTYRIQVFLNEETEIRPISYTGASTGHAFWGLLKRSMKKMPVAVESCEEDQEEKEEEG